MLEVEALQGEISFLTPFMPKRTEIALPVPTNLVISRYKSRDSHAVRTLLMHPPTSPYPVLSAEAQPISKGHCQK